MASLSPSNAGRVFADDDRPATSELGNTEERRRALDLLQQAAAELQANRFDAARRLATQAADLNATFSLFDVRPEHVLAEIERREKAAGGSGAAVNAGSEHEAVQAWKPVNGLVGTAAEAPDPFSWPQVGEPAKVGNSSAAAAETVPIAQASSERRADSSSAYPTSPDRLKARAIEILDRGLQALDEKRFDDAERSARAALSLQAAWSKLEYRPEYLITEIGIARARLRLDAATSQSAVQSRSSIAAPVVVSQPQASAVPQAESSRDATQGPVRPAPVSAQTAGSTRAAPVAQQIPASPGTASAQGAASSRERAERLLQEALTDLRAGRDDVARCRIEGALGVIHPGVSRPLLLFPAGSPAVASPQQSTYPPGMPRAVPSYKLDRAADERDVALKPLHDPFLGDEPSSTQKSTAGENSLRESTPQFVRLNPTYTLNRPLPVMTDEMRELASAPSSPAVATAAARTQTAADTGNQPANVRWPEGESTVPASQTAAAGPTQEGRVTVPVVSPAQPDARWSSGSRVPYAPPATDPWVPGTSDEQRPGYFHRLWNAMIGE
jgi:hypothetical protein